MGEQGERLEHHPDVAQVRRRRGDVLAVHQDATLGRPLETRDHPQRRRLPAAGGAEERDQLSGRQVEVDAGDGGRVAEPFDEALEPQPSPCVHLGTPRAR
jgi:hypothetical protein